MPTDPYRPMPTAPSLTLLVECGGGQHRVEGETIGELGHGFRALGFRATVDGDLLTVGMPGSDSFLVSTTPA